jgi:prepilin-type processing-associated H-X9-DG protein
MYPFTNSGLAEQGGAYPKEYAGSDKEDRKRDCRTFRDVIGLVAYFISAFAAIMAFCITISLKDDKQTLAVGLPISILTIPCCLAFCFLTRGHFPHRRYAWPRSRLVVEVLLCAATCFGLYILAGRVNDPALKGFKRSVSFADGHVDDGSLVSSRGQYGGYVYMDTDYQDHTREWAIANMAFTAIIA